jgi:catechol 2,3-dioxygenase-like lactoylglutathione lyase family enzyme
VTDPDMMSYGFPNHKQASFHSVVPLVPAGSDLTAALAFYTGQMGFSIVWRGEGMAGIARDGVAFNLVENGTRDWAENASFSIGVSDLEALYEEYRQVSAQVGELEVKAWGRREFHLIVPSGVCFQFYHHEAAS